MSLMLSAGTRYIPKRNRNFVRAATWKLGAWEPSPPCIKQRRYNSYSGKIEHVIEPLFTNSIFARCKPGS